MLPGVQFGRKAKRSSASFFPGGCDPIPIVERVAGRAQKQQRLRLPVRLDTLSQMIAGQRSIKPPNRLPQRNADNT